MLSVNLGYFIIKNEMQNSINIQSRRNQAFTGENDSNEYLAVSYFRLLPAISYNVYNVMFING